MPTDVFTTCTPGEEASIHAPVLSERAEKAAVSVAVVDEPVAASRGSADL
jgi:hypothetical protein